MFLVCKVQSSVQLMVFFFHWNKYEYITVDHVTNWHGRPIDDLYFKLHSAFYPGLITPAMFSTQLLFQAFFSHFSCVFNSTLRIINGHVAKETCFLVTNRVFNKLFSLQVCRRRVILWWRGRRFGVCRRRNLHNWLVVSLDSSQLWVRLSGCGLLELTF